MSKIRKHTAESLAAVVKISNTWKGVCLRLGVNPKSGSQDYLRRRAQLFKIDSSHFPGKSAGGFAQKPKMPQPLEFYMIENSTINSSTLRLRLLKSGLKKKQCEKCGKKTWLGSPIPLELHHINGEHTDCRFENLKILCPNCHAVETLYTGVVEQPDTAVLEAAAVKSVKVEILSPVPV